MLFKAVQAIDPYRAIIVTSHHCTCIERKLTTQQLRSSRRRLHKHCIQTATYNVHYQYYCLTTLQAANSTQQLFFTNQFKRLVISTVCEYMK